jgi:hypothetical protein
MKVLLVNINFEKMAVAFKSHVRLKALRAGSTIFYSQNGQLIEEDPRDSSKRIEKSSLAPV